MHGFYIDYDKVQKDSGFSRVHRYQLFFFAVKQSFNNKSQIAVTTCVLKAQTAHVMKLMQCKQEVDKPSCYTERGGGGPARFFCYLHTSPHDFNMLLNV